MQYSPLYEYLNETKEEEKTFDNRTEVSDKTKTTVILNLGKQRK